MKLRKNLFMLPYLFWILLFVILPLILIVVQSLFGTDGQFTLTNFVSFFTSGTYLSMTVNSFIYALIVTVITLVISYPVAYILTKLKHSQFFLLLIILPTWINVLLKAYAFIGLFSQSGWVNQFLGVFGIGPTQLLFTDFAFIFVASYIEIPFMILPIFNSLKTINGEYIHAANDLGATRFQTFTKVIWPLSLDGVKSGIQSIFIPTLSLFMITRLIGGNRVITLGTAIEQHFLTTMNWGMGSTIGVILMVIMIASMKLTNGSK
ncbi:ABC transporter permease [Holzapfeliella sp. He02]|uniref:ABC transporter permease n=1 Tax=Holzapfeliella saturejae TaxID=3082953 RepID=A0ABU8SFT4_9LACO